VVSVGLPEESRYFCRKRQAGFGIDVYRKSTGDPRPGKSSAKGIAASGHLTPAPAWGRPRPQPQMCLKAPHSRIGLQPYRLYS
jgi:hypothetical protein